MIYDNVMHPFDIWIRDKGLKKGKVARDLGISQGYLSHILWYKKFPSKMLALKISKYTGEEVSWQKILFPPFVSI